MRAGVGRAARMNSHPTPPFQDDATRRPETSTLPLQAGQSHMETSNGHSSYPPLEGEGRLAKRVARREPGWGAAAGVEMQRMNTSPHPGMSALSREHSDPPPPGEGQKAPISSYAIALPA